MQLSPDGSRLAAAFENGDIHIWDALTKDEVAVLRSSPQDCKSCATNIAWSADGSKLAVTGRNSQAVVWDVTQQQKLWSFKHGTSDTNIIAYPVFSPDGRFLATALYHEAIYVWDLVRGIEIDHHHAVSPPVFSQDGNRLVLVGEVGDALPFDENGQERSHNVLYLWDFAAHRATTFMTQGPINYPVLSVDGSKIFLLDGYKSYKLETWDPITGTMIRSLEIATPEDGILLYPQFSNDRRKLLLNWTANNKTIIVKKVVSVWDVEAGKEMFQIQQPSLYSRAYFMGDADGLIYTYTVDPDAPFYHKSELWNGQTGAYVLKLWQSSLSDNTQSPILLTPFSTWSSQADEIVLGTVFGDLYFWDLDGLSPS